MKLFKVRVEYETVIRAKDLKSAEWEANYIVKNEDDGGPSVVSAEEIQSIENIPNQWDVDCRPFGARDPYDRTIGELLK